MDRPSRPRAPVVAGLPDDLLLEVLSRVPFRSICRFKCVSRAWRNLITNPLHRCKLPQTLEGLFHEIHHHRRDRDGDDDEGGGDNFRRHICVGFVDLSGTSLPLVDPLFSFFRNLPASDSDDGIRLMDTSHGLLLLDRGGYNLDSSPSYVVCNPATKQWLAVPEPNWTPSPCNGMSAYLIFSPAVSLHFSLVQFTNEVLTGVTSVQTYSSKTGAWTHSEIAWSVEEKQAPCEGWRYQGFSLVPERKSTVINGMLYLICDSVGEGQVLDGDHIIAVDVEGKTRSFMPAAFQMRKEECSILSDFVGQSQGLLHYVNHEEPEYYQNNDAPSERYANGHTEGSEDDDVDYELSIWVLKVGDTQEFVLKHRVSFLHLFGEKSCQAGIDYSVAAIHPDRDIIIFTRDDKLISYDMDTKEVCALLTVSDAYGFTSYVPCYSESPALTDKY